MTYSVDFREAALAFKQKGHTIKQVCETFNITRGTYQNWTVQKRKNGNLKPKKHGPRKRKIDPNQLQQYVKEHPDAYLKEMAKHFNCKPSSMHNALVKQKITRKKVFTYSEKSPIKRENFVALLNKIPKAIRAYIDESGINKVLTREHGYALKGKQVEDVKRGKKFHRTNVVGGLFNGKVLAPHCYEHSTTGAFFEWWFGTQFLFLVPKGGCCVFG